MLSVTRRGMFAISLSLIVLITTIVSASARPINSVVVFGDSLSDNGNLSALTGGTFPDTVATGGQSAYLAGRLSNGTTWVENFASALSVPLVNRAYAGAFTDTRNTASAFVSGALGMQTTVNSYVSSLVGSADPNALFVLWGGANNYFSGETNPANPVNDIAGQISQLADAGARQFLVVNLPNLGNTPGGAASGNGAGLNTLTSFHNAGLNTAITGIQAIRPTVDIKLFDVNLLFQQVIANQAAFGLTNVTQPYVLSGTLPGQTVPTQGYRPTVINPAQDVNGYLFYDEIHPTAATHRIIAQRALATVVPEGSTAGLLGAGGSLLGAGVVLRRRRKA